MDLATGIATVAGGAAITAYLEAKYHIGKDVQFLSRFIRAQRELTKATKKYRISLWYFFEGNVKLHPHKDCLWSRTGEYNWKETYDQALRYAQFFLSQGVKPGQMVALFLQNRPEFMFAWLGLWAIGCAPAMINFHLAGDALVHCIKISGASVVLVDEEFGDRLEELHGRAGVELGVKIVHLSDAQKAEINNMEPKRPGREYRENVTQKDPSCLLFTSGTTGMPKCVAFANARAFQLAALRTKPFGLIPEVDRWYDCMPLYHGTGGITGVTCIMIGTPLCIGKKFSVTKFWDDIRDSRATFFTYVGETARYLLANPPSPRDKDHNVRCMYGNGLRPDVWQRFQERFGVTEVFEFFNSTEGVFGLANYSKGDYLAAAVGHHGLPLRIMFRNTYIPVEIDPITNELARDPKTGWVIRKPYEEGGEILVKAPSREIFSGYYGNEAATSKKFAVDVFGKGDCYYRTGDALRRTKDGRWFFVDRLGDTFRWKSENVSTVEVSECLGHFPGIIDANVYGVLVPGNDGRAGCAAIYIDPDARSSFDFDALLAHTRLSLPKYAVPLFLRLVPNMSSNHTNKQNKVALRDEGVDPAKVTDKILWLPPKGEGDGYIEFTAKDWERLGKGAVRL